MIRTKQPGENGKCQGCWCKLPTGTKVHIAEGKRSYERTVIAFRCVACGDFSPPPEPLDPSWYDKEPMPTGSYRMRSAWIRDPSHCTACGTRIHFGDWMYWKPAHGPRCVTCGDHPNKPDPWHLSERDIAMAKALGRVTLTCVN